MLQDAIEIFNDYSSFIVKGTLSTLMFAFIGTLVGFVIGLITGVIRTTPISDNKIIAIIQKIVNALIAVYVEVFRGTPLMVQAMVIYWGYAYMTGGKTLDLTLSGILIMTINSGAYQAEIVRGGIISIDKGQYEGAISIGMNHIQTMLYVVIPQVVRNILPSCSNEFINNIKDTSVLNVIGVTELYYFSGIIKRNTFKTFQTYIVICVIYLVITFIITRVLRMIESKLEGEQNYTMIGTMAKPGYTTRKHGDNND